MDSCNFITHPHFGPAAPSEADCLHLWVSIFSVLTDKVTLHTGEKILESSKLLRQMQSSEHGDVSDWGRKVDCMFMHSEIELSNIEFKCPNICPKEIAIQNRKNIRLARCIQESHLAMGASSSSVIMADVIGFTGVFYQVQHMGQVAVAGRTTPEIVNLPKNKGELQNFLEDSSLAIIWNFIEFLETQACKLKAVKERHKVSQNNKRIVKSIFKPRSSTPPPPEMRLFSNIVTFSPTKKRTWSMTNSSLSNLSPSVQEQLSESSREKTPSDTPQTSEADDDYDEL
ncbi:hypothetical protein BGZ76_003594 [Entomortierella beljakovae]|nr:hypothetical protein BGZ76_003594 [Entomortierella beljakovae]